VTIFVSALVVAILFAPLRHRLEAFLSRNDRSPSRVANER
jgi:predicted PurR-regulated permease PerM